MKKYREKIGYVPQDLIMIDATVAENIAFGQSQEEIDMNKIFEAAIKAQISDFIESSPNSYSTKMFANRILDI